MPFLIIGQKRVAEEINNFKAIHSKFERFSVLEENANGATSESIKAVKEATFATINLNEIQRIQDNKYQTIEIQIPYKGALIAIELYKVEPFATGFNVNTDQEKKCSYSKGVYYRGIVKGNDDSIAAFNFFNNEMNGIVSSAALGNLNIGKLVKKTNQKQYIIYADNNLLIDTNFTCQTPETTSETNRTQNRPQSANIQKTVTVYLEVGYQAYEANGSDMTATLNWITSIFNNVQTLYNNDGISIALKTIFVWTVDDYYKISSNYIVPAITNIRPSFDGDVAFIADIDPEGLGGQAFGIGELCGQGNVAYGDIHLDFDSVPNYSVSVNITAHELGHLLGSHHTHACVWNGNNTAIDGCATAYGGCTTPVTSPDFQGTIMSYCFSNLLFLGFGEQPASAIIQHINNSDCLSNDGNENCMNTIGTIEALEVTQNSATIAWTDSNIINTQWDFSIVPFGNAPIFMTTTLSSNTIENLTPNTYYEVVVRGTCDNALEYPKHSRIFATQGDNCNGIQIFDTGGPTGPYASNVHIIRTIVPTIPDKKIKITFNNVNLMPFADQIYIYDGLDNNGPLINRLYGGYPFRGSAQNNSATPATIQSQHPSGALTLEFFSRPAPFNTTVYNGWTATVSCLNILGNEEFGDGFIDYTFGPNPVKDILKIKSKDLIKEVKVYDIDGKLLLTKEASKTEVDIDFSTYKNGTYLAKLFYEKASASFKIIKD
ncbi:zinc-dependent metalloprotease [Flavobacterium sp.]|uniref:zinc-dependent metalloprotease n=1 Tax=Flavobacterium sp. TaxID=239 RepID=UPI0026396311|nr:zinc-dependent metalloprotease [Flavobacterium sp.]